MSQHHPGPDSERQSVCVCVCVLVCVCVYGGDRKIEREQVNGREDKVLAKHNAPLYQREQVIAHSIITAIQKNSIIIHHR